jgi:iron complex outermembrane recepter protein
VIAKPNFDGYAGNASLTLGNYSTVNTTGTVNMPLGDQWAMHAAFQTTRHDGYFTNGYDDANNFGARVSLLYRPSDNTSLLFMVDAYRNRQRGPGNTMLSYFGDSQRYPVPGDPWFGFGPAGSCNDARFCPSFASVAVGGINARVGLGGSPSTGFGDLTPNGLGTKSVWGGDGYNNQDQNIYSLELNTRTGIGDLTMLAAHVHTKIDFLSYNTLLFYNLTTAHQNSLEVRLASNGTGPLKWLIGGYYFDENQDARQDNMQAPGWAIINTPNLKDSNYAFFGDITYAATDRLRLLAGVRHTSETKSQDGWTSITGVTTLFTTFQGLGATCLVGTVAAPVVLFPGRPSPSNICLIPNSGNPTFTDTSYKAGIEFDLMPSSMLYGTVKSGFRSGGFTAGTSNTYLPEKLTAYEIGSRNRFMNNRMQFNATAFYWDYKDEQFSGLRAYLFNGFVAGQAGYPFNGNGTLQGLELDLRALVTDNDIVAVNALYSKGKITDTPNIVNSQGVTGPLHNVDRYNLPDWTYSASYNHIFRLGNGGKLDIGLNGHYEPATIVRLADPLLLRTADFKPGYSKWNADMTYTPEGSKWDFQVFIKNLTNEDVIGLGAAGQIGGGVWFQPSMNQTGSRSVGLEPPRTFGLRLSTRF